MAFRRAHPARAQRDANRRAAVIRPLHPDDASSLHALFSEPSPLTCDYFEPGTDLEVFQSFANAPRGEQYRLVAVRDQRLAGLGILERFSDAPRLAHLGRIRFLASNATLESESGDQLMLALIDVADNWLNLKRLEVDAPASVPALAALLRRVDFVSEGVMRKSISFGPDFDDEYAFARLRGFEGKEHLKRSPIKSVQTTSARLSNARLSIRPLAATDINDLYEIFRAPANCRTTLQLPSQELWRTRQRVLEPPPGMIRLVAEYQGRAIGMISLRPRQTRCRDHVGGIGMMVHPEYWGRGVGSRLMEQLLDRASHQLDLTRIVLEVHTDNPAGIRLYEKFGFVNEGTKRFHSFGAGGWADTHFMARMIE